MAVIYPAGGGTIAQPSPSSTPVTGQPPPGWSTSFSSNLGFNDKPVVVNNPGVVIQPSVVVTAQDIQRIGQQSILSPGVIISGQPSAGFPNAPFSNQYTVKASVAQGAGPAYRQMTPAEVQGYSKTGIPDTGQFMVKDDVYYTTAPPPQEYKTGPPPPGWSTPLSYSLVEKNTSISFLDIWNRSSYTPPAFNRMANGTKTSVSIVNPVAPEKTWEQSEYEKNRKEINAMWHFGDVPVIGESMLSSAAGITTGLSEINKAARERSSHWESPTTWGEVGGLVRGGELALTSAGQAYFTGRGAALVLTVPMTAVMSQPLFVAQGAAVAGYTILGTGIEAGSAYSGKREMKLGNIISNIGSIDTSKELSQTSFDITKGPGTQIRTANLISGGVIGFGAAANEPEKKGIEGAAIGAAVSLGLGEAGYQAAQRGYFLKAGPTWVDTIQGETRTQRMTGFAIGIEHIDTTTGAFTFKGVAPQFQKVAGDIIQPKGVVETILYRPSAQSISEIQAVNRDFFSNAKVDPGELVKRITPEEARITSKYDATIIGSKAEGSLEKQGSFLSKVEGSRLGIEKSPDIDIKLGLGQEYKVKGIGEELGITFKETTPPMSYAGMPPTASKFVGGGWDISVPKYAAWTPKAPGMLANIPMASTREDVSAYGKEVPVVTGYQQIASKTTALGFKGSSIINIEPGKEKYLNDWQSLVRWGGGESDAGKGYVPKTASFYSSIMAVPVSSMTGKSAASLFSLGIIGPGSASGSFRGSLGLPSIGSQSVSIPKPSPGSPSWSFPSPSFSISGGSSITVPPPSIPVPSIPSTPSVPSSPPSQQSLPSLSISSSISMNAAPIIGGGFFGLPVMPGSGKGEGVAGSAKAKGLGKVFDMLRTYQKAPKLKGEIKAGKVPDMLKNPPKITIPELRPQAIHLTKLKVKK